MSGASGAIVMIPRRSPGAARTCSTSIPRAWIKRAMEHLMANGEALMKPRELSSRRRFGFTFIELMIVMAIIAVLMAVAVPIYTRSIQRSKESVLRSNLYTLRTVIDEYTYDKQKAPQSLQDLVTEGYLREVPKDPMTDSNTTWRLVMEDAVQSVNQNEPGIFDVHSGSDKIGLDGTPYAGDNW